MSMFRGGQRAAQLVQLERDRAARDRDVAEAERHRLRTALDALGTGVVLADSNGVLQVRNEAATRFSGHEAILVKSAVDALLRTASKGQPATRTVEFAGPPRRVLVVHASPLADGFALATIEDVSERVRLDAVRTDFVANISHELKTPVGALAVLAEAAADSGEPDIMRRLAGRMVDEAHRAARTIDDLLELSRIELGGQAVQEVVDVHGVLLEATERARTMAVQQGISVIVGSVGHATKAVGDSRQLVSAMANMIDNAVKYSDEGSIVTVSAAEHDGWVDLAVEDHGVGIPARDLDRVFERFYRVDQARSRTTGGTGLGLAIVRHVATNHGGDVLVRSEEGVGSTFTLRVPSAGHPVPAARDVTPGVDPAVVFDVAEGAT
ncbi:MAG: phoR [Ilumatobacteraceae bacterium]|nr:phoR [Ilumatobacteraceae bacterium]